MFDIGWSELLIIAVVAILVVGPKDLPRLLRQLGNYVGKIKQTANEFKSQFDEAIRDSEFDDIKSSVDELARANPMNELKSEIEDSLEIDMYDEMDDLDLDVEGPVESDPKEIVHNKKSKEPGPSPDHDADVEEKSISIEPHADSESSGGAKDKNTLATENRGA